MIPKNLPFEKYPTFSVLTFDSWKISLAYFWLFVIQIDSVEGMWSFHWTKKGPVDTAGSRLEMREFSLGTRMRHSPAETKKRNCNGHLILAPYIWCQQVRCGHNLHFMQTRMISLWLFHVLENEMTFCFLFVFPFFVGICKQSWPRPF